MLAGNTCWRQRKYTCNRYPAGVKPTLRFQGHFPPHLLPHQLVAYRELTQGITENPECRPGPFGTTVIDPMIAILHVARPALPAFAPCSPGYLASVKLM